MGVIVFSSLGESRRRYHKAEPDAAITRSRARGRVSRGKEGVRTFLDGILIKRSGRRPFADVACLVMRL